MSHLDISIGITRVPSPTFSAAVKGTILHNAKTSALSFSIVG